MSIDTSKFAVEGIESDSHYTWWKRKEFAVTAPDGTVICKAECELIQRHRMRKESYFDFHILLDETTHEIFELSKLFNAHGGFKRGYQGLWGNEMNNGDLAYIAEMYVLPQYRRMGLGTWMLKRIIDDQFFGTSKIIFIWPTVLNKYEDALNPFQRQTFNDRRRYHLRMNLNVMFVRKFGFRRISDTEFFAFARDPEHQSHQIGLLPFTLSRRGTHKEQAFNTRNKLKKTLLNVYNLNPASLCVGDDFGHTPLHYAAKMIDLDALEILLQELPGGRRRASAKCKCATNKIPLEYLEESWRKLKEKRFLKEEAYRKGKALFEEVLAEEDVDEPEGKLGQMADYGMLYANPEFQVALLELWRS